MDEDEPAFRTATELREESASTDRFVIPEHPERRYPASGGVEYVGEVVFVCSPTPEQDEGTLAARLESVLEAGPYRFGDWFELPLPLFLVHDDETGDTFRVAVRDGTVELHVLPSTGAAGLERLYDRLTDATPWHWRVDRRISPPD